MVASFKNPLDGSISGRYKGVIHGTGKRYKGLVPMKYFWYTQWDEPKGWLYVHVTRYNEETDRYRPFTWLKVKKRKGIRGASPSTHLKMIKELTNRILEHEQEGHGLTTLGKDRSPKPKRRKK